MRDVRAPAYVYLDVHRASSGTAVHDEFRIDEVQLEAVYYHRWTRHGIQSQVEEEAGGGTPRQAFCWTLRHSGAAAAAALMPPHEVARARSCRRFVLFDTSLRFDISLLTPKKLGENFGEISFPFRYASPFPFKYASPKRRNSDVSAEKN